MGERETASERAARIRAYAEVVEYQRCDACGQERTAVVQWWADWADYPTDIRAACIRHAMTLLPPEDA